MGHAPFSRVLAEAAAKQSMADAVAVSRFNSRLSCQMTSLVAGGMPQPMGTGTFNVYLEENVDTSTPDERSKMHEAARRVEAALQSSSSMSAAELKRLRREVARIVHPDLCLGEHQREAEELMKSVNVLVATALDSRPRS